MRGIRLHRVDAPDAGTVAVAHLGADQLVHEQLAVGRGAERLGARRQLAAQRFRCVAIVDARELHDPAAAPTRGRLDHELTIADEQVRSRREALCDGC